jgi:hypothetical protein
MTSAETRKSEADRNIGAIANFPRRHANMSV